MLKKKIFPGLIIIFLAAVVVGLFLLPGPTRSVEESPTERVAEVKVMEVKPEQLTEWIDLPASVEAYLSAEVPAEVSGRIDWIGPKEGSTVSKGAPIMRIDQRTFQSEVDEAQASYDLASNECKRFEELYHEGIISSERLDQCKANVTTNFAKLEVVKVQLEKATVRSPIDGVLNKLDFDEGEFVRQGDKVADLVVINPVKVVAKVPEKDISYIHSGGKVDVLFGMSDEKNYRGTVSYISVVGDPATRTYEVEITVPNPSLEILPAMIARVQIVRQQISNAVSIPLFSVIPKGDFKAIFVEKGGRAEERLIKLGVLQENRVQVLEGLQPRERLIVEGHRELSDGEAVRVQGTVEDAS
jgi:membrane fusion protein (multidrug efflux system)